MFTENSPYYMCWNTETFGNLKKLYNQFGIKNIKYAFIHGGNTNQEYKDIAEYIKLGGTATLSFDTHNLDSIDLFNYYKKVIEDTNCYNLDFVFSNSLDNILIKYHIEILQELLVLFPKLNTSISIPYNSYDIANLYHQNNFNLTCVNCIFDDRDVDITIIKKYIEKMSSRINLPINKLGVVFRLNNIELVHELSEWTISSPINNITFFGLQLDSDLQACNILNNIGIIQRVTFCDTLVNKSLLENIISQYHLPEWLVIDNVTLGDSWEFDGEMIKTYDIDTLLNSLKGSNECTIVNFDNCKSAYTKNGIGSFAKNKSNFSTFILKNQIPKKSILNTLL